MSRDIARTVAHALQVAALMVVLSGGPRDVRASTPLNWFGNDAKGMAQGGTGVAISRGASDLLLNPALMSFRNGGLWLTFSAAPNFLSIDPAERDPAYDVPEDIYQTSPVGWPRDRPVPTSMLTNRRGPTEDLPTAFLLSIVAVDTFFHERLRLGLGFTAPLPKLAAIDSWYNDEREQHFSNRLHFERFGEFASVMTVYPGASFAPIEWLSIGFTLQVDLALAIDARMFLTEGTDWEYSYFNAGGGVVPSLRPIFGVAFRTPIGFSGGLVYRHESYFESKVDVDLRVWNGERPIPDSDELQMQFLQSHRFVFGYQPREVALAAGFEHGPFSVEIGASWQQWSRYLDRHGNHYTHPTTDPDDVITADGWDDDWKDPVFDDGFTMRGGAEVWVVDFLALRAGAGYFPSPMPPQTGRYNYIDNDLILYSMGVGARFPVLGRQVTVDLAAQLWQMKALEVNKTLSAKEDGGIIDEVPDTVTDFYGQPLAGGQGLQTNNPGFPGYALSGVVLNLCVMLGLEFDSLPPAEQSPGSNTK
ncbi:MAG TPA: hypothetical protein VM285_15040 [Polyangia bacterium]|nr:hypothetical protein [Polyangia bacterium]